MKPVCNTWGIIRPDRLGKVQSRRISTGEHLGLLADITGQSNIVGVEIHQEILPSEHRSSPPHRHTRRNEIIYVLEGNPTVRLDGRDKRMNAGEFVIFHPNDRKYHMIFNGSSQPAKLLVISFNSEDDKVYFMPEQLDMFGDRGF